MGEATTGLSTTEAASKQRVRELERDIAGIREEMDAVAVELDARRRAATDIRRQAREHPVAMLLAGLAIAALTTSAVALGRRQRRREGSLLAKARRLRRAMRRMVEAPERVARGEPSPWAKLLTAAGAAAAGTLARRAAERAFEAR